MSKHSKAAKAYRGDHACVTTKERVIHVGLSALEFQVLDHVARDKNTTRTAIAREILVAELATRWDKHLRGAR
jgi:hypothetical protein